MASVAEAIGAALAQHDPGYVFGLLGSGNLVLTNALVAGGARFVGARHEGGAVSMADAYAQVSGSVGWCTVHQGPGLTNTMTGLAEAAKSRTPLLLLAADTAASAIRSNFRIAQDQLVTSVGAVAERVYSPQTAVADAVRALRRARGEERPVVLMLPLDIQAAPAPAEIPPPPPPARTRAVSPAPASIGEAADALLRAQRPLIVAGRGARNAAAGPALETLAELLGAMLATSAVANGLFAASPWALGIAGGFASPTAAELIGEADVVLGAGAALNMWTTRHGRLLNPTATVIQVDHNADALGAHHRIDIAVLGDVAEAARMLADAVRARRSHTAGWRSPALQERIKRGGWSAEAYADAGGSDGIDPRTLSRELDHRLPIERTVAIDSGHFMGYPAMYLRVPDERGFVFTQAFQAVGLGLASAIGAATARPDRLTVAALGDGGALIGLSDLETVARLGLRMLIVVYNDAAYGAEVHHFAPLGQSTELVRFPDVDFAALGRAVGLNGVTVRAPADLEPLTGWLASGGRPGMLIDAKVVPTVVAEWLEEAFRGH